MAEGINQEEFTVTEEAMEIFEGVEEMETSEGEESSQGEESDIGERDSESGTFTVPETTIRRINKEREDFIGKSNDDICKFIIAKYNGDENGDNNGDNNGDYKPIELRKESHAQFKKASTRYLVYHDEKRTVPSFENMREVGQNENRAQNTTVSQVMFLISKKKNIYCLTYGQGYRVVEGFEDDGFVKGVARYVTKKEIRRFGMRNLRGIDYAVSRFYRNPTIPHRLQVDGVVTSIESRVSDVTLESNEGLTLKTGVGARVELSRSGVRFKKNLKVDKMCKLINWLDDANVRQKGDGSDIMDYISEVKSTEQELQEKLDGIMFETVIKYMTNKDNTTSKAMADPPPFDFMYKDFEKYMNGRDFTFHLPYERDTTDNNMFESFDDAVSDLKEFLKSAMLNKVKLSFKCGEESVQQTVPFVKLLHGKVRYQESEYFYDGGEWKVEGKGKNDGGEWKVEGKGKNDGGEWKVEEKGVTKDLKSMLDTILTDCILNDMAEANSSSKNERFEIYFEERKQGSNLKQCSFVINSQKSTEKKASAKDKKSAKKQRLWNLSSYREALCELKLYLKKSMKGKFTADGRIIRDEMMNYFHGEVVLGDRIYHKVDGKWYRYDQQFNECLKDSFHTLVVQKLKDGTKDDIHLPEVWPPYMIEKNYNQLYLAPKYDGCYFVGDTIKPYNVELFDIAKVSEDTIYLYHVKLGFGSITRDACSQIRNSASAISASRHGGGEGNYLEEYYNVVTTYNREEKFRITERKRLSNVKRHEFLNWFRTKRIVFVYAFAYKVELSKNDPKHGDSNSAARKQGGNSSKVVEVGVSSGDQTKSDDTQAPKAAVKEYRIEKLLRSYLENIDTNKDELAEFSKSNIAKHDLHCTNVYLEELGFEFAMCQISRFNSKEQAVKVKREESE